jgi:transcriptional regulator with XRE-family HTH domain
MKTRDLGTLIRLAREDVGMTQRELAAAAGVQQPTISAYESGAKVLTERQADNPFFAHILDEAVPL